MTLLIRGYLSDLGRQLHLRPGEEREILHELQAHIEDKTSELIEAGVSSDEALDHALKDLGTSERIAQEFYQVHSRGSWYHTVLAVLPHILLSVMFAFHLWTTPAWVAFMLAVVLIIGVLGWRKGRPRWTYPWLGYCLVVPIVSWGLAMSAVAYGAWSVITRGFLPLGIPIYFVSFAYVAFSLWVVIKIVSRAARPDWIMASLAGLPIPFLAYWFFYFYNRSDFPRSEASVDSSAAIVFLVLAAITAIFFRIGKRLVRVGLLAITAPSMVVLAWFSYQGGTGYVALFSFSAISLAVLLSPALFDLKEDHDYQPHLSTDQLPLDRSI